MPRPRGLVLLTWVFCAVISITALYKVVFILTHATKAADQYANVIFALVPIFFAFPASLIITHQPRNPIGWLMMIDPLVEIPTNWFSVYLSGFPSSPPPATFTNVFMAWLVSLSWMALIFPILLIPLFFPTGRLISPRWRWTIFLTIGMTLFLMVWGALTRTIYLDFMPWTMTNPVGFISEETTNAILPPWSLLLAVVTIASLLSIVVRYRRGSMVERIQMKWLLYACFLFGFVYIPGVISNTDTSQWSVDAVTNFLLPFAIMTIPAAITIAVLRYHLFDIDVIIRLTLVYGILTGLLGSVYIGGVVLLQQFFRFLTGQTTEAAIVITTLAIAALFNPLRRRVQAVIDRRLFRQKYNTEQALAKFTVVARDNTDPDALMAMLAEVVQETLQPTQIGLYVMKKK